MSETSRPFEQPDRRISNATIRRRRIGAVLVVGAVGIGAPSAIDEGKNALSKAFELNCQPSGETAALEQGETLWKFAGTLAEQQGRNTGDIVAEILDPEVNPISPAELPAYTEFNLPECD